MIRKTKKGFSLIELIIAFGLLAVLAVTSTQMLMTGVRNNKKAAAISLVKSEGEMVLNRMEKMVQFAQNINNVSNNTLELIDQNAADVTYTFTGDNIASESAKAGTDFELFSDKVTVSDCGGGVVFSQTNARVKICFRLEVALAEGVVDKAGTTMGMTFETTVWPRN